MRYHLGHVVLDLHHGLADETTYVFENKTRDHSLFVSFEPIPPGATPDDVLNKLVDSVYRGYQGMCTQRMRKPRVFRGAPAAQSFLQIALALGGGEVHLLASTGAGQLTLLKFFTEKETEDGEGQATFEHILRSAASAQEPWSSQGAHGHVRYQAGPLTLEVPDTLAPPRKFIFATPDRSVRLMLQYEKGIATMGAPPFEELLPPLDSTSHLERLSEKEKPFEAVGLKGFVGRWELRCMNEEDRKLEQYLFHVLSVQVHGGLTFRALGIASTAGHATLESAWAQLTTTLRPGN